MKKAMQRMLSLVLAAVLSLSLACPAFAAGGAQPVALPDQDWQGAVTFPDWKGYVDDTLAMNSLYSFTCFRDQGELYVTPAEGVTSLSTMPRLTPPAWGRGAPGRWISPA